MLVEMLKQNPKFTELPLEKQEVMARLAGEFEDNDFALYLTPQELTDKLQLGNKQLWQDFLNIEAVAQYVNTQVANNLRIVSRKQIKALEREALQGNIQAAQHIDKMSGVLNSGERNKVVVLHQINRPPIIRREATQ